MRVLSPPSRLVSCCTVHRRAHVIRSFGVHVIFIPFASSKLIEYNSTPFTLSIQFYYYATAFIGKKWWWLQPNVLASIGATPIFITKLAIACAYFLVSFFSLMLCEQASSAHTDGQTKRRCCALLLWYYMLNGT